MKLKQQNHPKVHPLRSLLLRRTAAEDAAAETNAAEETKKKWPTSFVARAEANAAEEEAENKKRKKRQNKIQNRAKKHKMQRMEKLGDRLVLDCMVKYGLSLETDLFTKHTREVRDYYGVRRFEPRLDALSDEKAAEIKTSSKVGSHTIFLRIGLKFRKEYIEKVARQAIHNHGASSSTTQVPAADSSKYTDAVNAATREMEEFTDSELEEGEVREYGRAKSNIFRGGGPNPSFIYGHGTPPLPRKTTNLFHPASTTSPVDAATREMGEVTNMDISDSKPEGDEVREYGRANSNICRGGEPNPSFISGDGTPPLPGEATNLSHPASMTSLENDSPNAIIESENEGQEPPRLSKPGLPPVSPSKIEPQPAPHED
jgi:hypothetical protein